jgi:serine/threonine protein kinase
MPDLFDNKYQFVKELGVGGCGKVFLAREKFSESFVAIKQLKNEDESWQDDIIHEMQMVSKFNHPHIVNYKHHFLQNKLLYLVMEYCPGGSLRNWMRKRDIVRTNIWKWMEILTDTFQFVHEKGIIHHDIKPDNILFDENRKIKISDFGVANTGGGTRAYMAPETLDWRADNEGDVRIDIYALGVTLLEVMTGKNPFLFKSDEEIIAVHEKKEFGIEGFPDWQQDIVLKAIAKTPELRFQTMQEFNEAIRAKAVPLIFDKEIIKGGFLADKAAYYLKRKKWKRAYMLLDYAEKSLKPNVNVFFQLGKYHLLSYQIQAAKSYFEKALKWNPRLDVQKELGWINLELKNYPLAISMLSDHVQRNPSDFEAYNLILQCYYETGRYEAAMELAATLLGNDSANPCFINNYYISFAMHHLGERVAPDQILKKFDKSNPFLQYNYELIMEEELSHNYGLPPALKSKLLFMDYRFLKFTTAPFYCSNNDLDCFGNNGTTNAIIKFGRENFEVNDVKVPGGNSISRRHCLIINQKDDIWLYDLGSTGTFLNGEKVLRKQPLPGKNILRIGQTQFELTSDKSKLL